MGNNFLESIKSDHPQKIHQMSKENQILIQKLSQIPQDKQLLNDGEIEDVLDLIRRTLIIYSECKEILRDGNEVVTNSPYNNEKLMEIIDERKEIESCLNLLDQLQSDFDMISIDSELIMRNMGKDRGYKNASTRKNNAKKFRKRRKA